MRINPNRSQNVAYYIFICALIVQFGTRIAYTVLIYIFYTLRAYWADTIEAPYAYGKCLIQMWHELSINDIHIDKLFNLIYF